MQSHFDPQGYDYMKLYARDLMADAEFERMAATCEEPAPAIFSQVGAMVGQALIRLGTWMAGPAAAGVEQTFKGI